MITPLFITLFMTFVGCADQTPREVSQYRVAALEGYSITAPQDDVIIADARTRIPELLAGCGVRDLVVKSATDSVVLFDFDASEEQRDCLIVALPNGAHFSLMDGPATIADIPLKDAN